MLSLTNIPVLILIVLCLRIIYQRLTNPLAKLPGPEISKWTDLFAGKVPYYVHHLHERYGPVVRTSTTQVDICDVGAAREIHKTNTKFLKSKFYEAIIAKGIENLFNTTDPKFHANRRRLLATPISDSSLSKHQPLISGRVQLAVDKMAEEMKSTGATDVFKWWLFMATDVIGELSFGESFRMLEKGESNDACANYLRQKNQYTKDLESISSLQPIKTTFPNMVDIARRLPIPIFQKAGQTTNRMVSYAVQSLDRYAAHVAENPENPKPSLFTKLLDSEKSGMSRLEIIREAQDYIVAGSDTTAVTLTYLVYSVCRDFRVRDRLVAELVSLPQPIEDKDLRELPYLSCVITETLRLHTAVPFGLPRAVPVEGATLKDTFIPGGATVSTQSYSLHRDPGIFAEPERFYPERWENPTKDMKDASLPFGGGSRICIGIHLARIELRLATALFFSRFPNASISTKDGMCEEDMIMKAFFLMAPQGHRCLVQN
ncbi:hypothetical protein N7456_011309 [Penicillium angulare]|uniref:Cytochrome P450 n=1 Tax=Penicillium angulare TaxID=116970 RepID=A0A9W9ETD9_9EURO|nr:hypothetical protein N7456_011309 [Penicillium angulare]